MSPLCRSLVVLLAWVVPDRATETGQLLPQEEKAPSERPTVRTDRHGDPLPPGAIARLGTLRWRHGSYVSAVAFSPDGKVLASVGGDRVLLLSEVPGGKAICRVKLKGEDRPFVAFAPDGQSLAVANAVDAGVCLLDAITGRELSSLVEGAAAIESVHFASDAKTLVVAYEPHHMYLWEVGTRKVLRRFQGYQGPVKAVALSPDGKTLAAGDGGTVRLWDVATGKPLHKLRRHQGSVTALAFSRDGRTLASGGDEDATVRLWDTATGRELCRFSHPRTAQHEAGRQGVHWHDVGATSVAIAPDGKTVYSCGSGDRFLRRWDAATGQELFRLEGAPCGNTPLALSPDGKVLAAGSEDGSVRLWDTATGRPLGPDGEPRHRVVMLTFSGDGGRLVAVNRDGVIRVWDPVGGRQLRRLGDEGHEEPLVRVAVSPDGRVLAAGRTDDETIVLWDLTTGRELRRLEKPQVGVVSLALSGDGSLLLSLSAENTASLWDVGAGRLRLLLGQGRRLRGRAPMALSADGKRALLLEKPHGASLWDTSKGDLLQTYDFQEEQNGGVYRVAFSPDGKTLAASADTNVVSLWAVDTGRQLLRLDNQGLRTPEGMVVWESAAFSADGRLLASIGQEGLVHVWELASGQELGRFRDQDSWLGALAFAPDGRSLATGSLDSTIVLWDLTGLRPEGRLPTRIPSPAESQRLWEDLADADAARAHRALWSLVAGGAPTVSFLRQRLRPAAPPEAGPLARIVADLDDSQFEVREKASRSLEELGPAAAPVLQRLLAGNPSPEVRRRIEQALEKWETAALSGDLLRDLRALAVLEQSGTPEAWKVLESLARGMPGARLTQDARATLERHGKRPGGPP